MDKKEVLDLFDNYAEEVFDFVNGEIFENKNVRNLFGDFLVGLFNAKELNNDEEIKIAVLGDAYYEEQNLKAICDFLTENNIVVDRDPDEIERCSYNLLEDLSVEDYEAAIDTLESCFDTSIFDNFTKKQLKEMLEKFFNDKIVDNI